MGAVKMPVPEDPLLQDLLASAATELKDLPHIKELNEPLAIAFRDLRSLLGNKTERSWNTEQCKDAFRRLPKALQKALSLAAKWKRSKLRILLYWSTFAEDLCAALMKIRNLFYTLEVKPTKRDIAREIVKRLDRVVQGLRDRGDGSELFLAASDFKKKLSDFLRANQVKSETSGATISISTWIANHLGSEVDTIRQELQEIKDNTDSTFHADQDLDAVLLEQLLLSLAVIEEKTAGEATILAEVKARLQCSICDGLMMSPVTVESGSSFCKPCMEERFRLGYSTCPVNKTEISKNLVINVALQNVIFCFGEAEEPPAPEAPTEEGESSDANLEGAPFDENSERRVQVALEYLTSPAQPKVLTGFSNLIKCASLPGGALAVFTASYSHPLLDSPVKAIPKAYRLAETQDPLYSRLAMKLMVALTAERMSAGPDNEITLEVADGLDVLISLMKEGRVTRTRLLAAETVANILVNRQVRKTVRSYDGIVPALYALSNVDPASVSPKEFKKADSVCLLGLQRLAKCSKRGDKTQMIVAALLKLLRRGLSYQPELTSLVKDSLVALENIVMKMKPTANDTKDNEVLNVILKDMKDLLAKKEFEAHITVQGRMAIISIMKKLCGLYEEIIDKYLFLLLLKMMERTRVEIASLLALSPPPEEQLNNLKTLLGRSVRLLCYCVTHGKGTAQSVLKENAQERKTLEEMVRRENSGILDEARLEIQSILDQINVEITPATVVGKIEVLVKLSRSEDQSCRQQVASKFRTFVAEKQNLSEFKAAGGINALMTLLRDQNPNCQRDALIALQDLSLTDTVEIPVDHLPFQIILDFLDERRPTEEKDAAIGLLDLIVKVPDGPAKFVQTRGAFKTTLNFLRRGAESPKCASALLEMARANESVRQRIAEPDLHGLDILVNYVGHHAKEPSSFQLKELLTDTLVLFCKSGDSCQEAVIHADGHVFLLKSLREKIAKGGAAEGLLELIQIPGFREKVLEAGYVKVAVESIDARFVRTDIALGLAELSSFHEGLEQICTETLSASALLNLLEHCREAKGKNAAALVISRLYPRLKRPTDLDRRKIIADRCHVFFNIVKINPLDVPYIKAFLEALAAIAADVNYIGRTTIHECRGNQLLIENLSVSQTTEIQGLMLKILADTSSETDDNNMSRVVTNVRDKLYTGGIAEKLFALFKSNDFQNRTENVKSGLIIIRNLSLLGSAICERLAEQGAVEILLDVLKRCEGSLSVTTELTVKALEKFMDNLSGKQMLVEGGGIKSLAAVLKLDTYRSTGDAKSCSAIILTAVARDEQTRKDACDKIFDCDILPALNEIIKNGETNRIKWQAAVLMKLLAMYGPTKNVCIAMRAKDCLGALMTLQNVVHCSEMANDVLKFVSEKNRDCKKYIEMHSTSNRGR